MAEACVAGRVTRRPRLRTAVRWLLVIVFAWSAGGKFFWPTKLQGILHRTGMVPRQFVAPLAYGLPTVELALALGLATPWVRVPALLGAIFLSTVFVGVHGYLLFCGQVVPCGCAGVALNFDSRWFHVGLLGLSILMAVGSVFLLLSRAGDSVPRLSTGGAKTRAGREPPGPR